MILLDTCAWLWWFSEPQYLSKKAKFIIDSAALSSIVCVSSISAWELAIKVQKGKLALKGSIREFVNKATLLPFFKFIPLDENIGIYSVELPSIHNDPIDRFILATSLKMKIPLVTADEILKKYTCVDIIW